MDCFNLTPLKLLFLFVGGIFLILQSSWWVNKKSFSTASIKSINQKNNMHKVLPLPLVAMCSTACFPTICSQIKKYFVSQGSLWAAWEGRPPWAPESIAQVQCDEEADDECHCAAQRAGICGAAGIANCSGDHFIFSFCEPLECELLYCFKSKILQWLKFI